MQDKWIPRALFASVLGLGVTAGLIRADQPPIPSPQVIVEPGPTSEVGGTVAMPGAAADIKPTPRRHFVCDAIHKYIVSHPWYCWSHHNSVGCGSWKAEWDFLWGSCRTFYGEPCFKGPPPPPNYLYYGYAPPPAPPSGCRCP
jgi:hypothetical protein